MTVLARCHHDEFHLGLQLNEQPLAMLLPATKVRTTCRSHRATQSWFAGLRLWMGSTERCRIQR